MSVPTVVQKSSKVWDVKSSALSTLMVLIGFSGNCAFNFRIWASILENTKFRVDNSDTCDHFEEASVITKKNQNGPLGGCIGPHTSAWILSKKFGMLFSAVLGDGLIIIFPCEQVRHGSIRDLGCSIFGIPCESLIFFGAYWFLGGPVSGAILL